MELSTLNDSQRRAVLFCDAPMLVIAGAGSGKTRVLTYKIAWLMEQGYEPWQIMALTFTNKAAREMQERIALQVGHERASQLWMGTFHSIFCRILRMECAAIGYRSDFTIYDAADSKNLVRTLIKEMGLDEKTYRPSLVCSRISRAKNALVQPADYPANSTFRYEDDRAMVPRVADIYAAYNRRLLGAQAMDFDDILAYTWVLFSQHPEVAEKYATRFRYLLVDEYQDTNYAQHQIVRMLVSRHNRVCVVGDDAQSIYSFRGANIDNILAFQTQYPDAQLFKLEQNYRSTQVIVDAANSLISHNTHRIPKQVYSMGQQGERIRYHLTYSDIDEANLIRRHVQHLVRDNHLLHNQIAILYRTNAQSRALEEALRKGNIPYRIFVGLSFFQRKEVKDLISYLRLALNPNDEEAFKRVVNYPARGIGATTLQRVLQYASSHDVSAFETLSHLSEAGVTRAAAVRLDAFRQLILSIHEQVETMDCFSLARKVLEDSTMRSDIFSSNDPEALSRQENLQELMDSIGAFVDTAREEGRGFLLRNYLQEVSFLADIDTDDSASEDKVTLMTIHSAKGLEFEAVIVAGLEEGLFPGEMSIENRQVEEERRLMYVAMTRARSFLMLTSSRTRFRYGKTEFFQPSRFIREIAPQYLDADSFGGSSVERQSASFTPRVPPVECVPLPRPSFSSLRPLPKPTVSAASSSGSLASPSSLVPGMRVQHDRFGLGTVKELEGHGIDAKAVVVFDNAGSKRLFLRFAKLTPVAGN